MNFIYSYIIIYILYIFILYYIIMFILYYIYLYYVITLLLYYIIYQIEGNVIFFLMVAIVCNFGMFLLR